MSTPSEKLFALSAETPRHPLVDRQRLLTASLNGRFSIASRSVAHFDRLVVHIDVDILVKVFCPINETKLNEQIHDSFMTSHMQAATLVIGTHTKAPVRLETLRDADSAELLGWRVAIVLEDALIEDLNFLEIQACSTMNLILIHAL